MDKRSFTRQVLHYPARLSSPQQNPAPCTIKDFCKTGLFVTYQQAPNQPAATSIQPYVINDILHIDFETPGSLKINYRLHVRVARIADGALGLEITHHNPEAVHALYKLAKEPAAATEKKLSASQREVQKKCRQLISNLLASNSRQLFTDIHDILMKRAKKAIDNQQETAFVDASTRFLKYQQRITDIYHNTTLSQVDNWIDGEPVTLPATHKVERAEKAENASGLSLIGKDDFEDWLLIKVIINKADQHYQETLYNLQLRMSEISTVTMSDKNNPVNPTYVCHSFYRAIEPLALPREVTQAVIKAFEGTVIVNGLTNLYAALNQLLIDNNILPIITYGTKSSAQHSPPTQSKKNPPETSIDPAPQADPDTPQTKPNAPHAQPASVPMAGQPQPASAPMAGQPEPASFSTSEDIHPPQPDAIKTWSTVQHLIGLQHQASAKGERSAVNASSAADSASYFKADQVISQLTQLQSQSLSLGTNGQSLSERIAELFCEDDRQLCQRDSTAVDVTEKFFGSITTNQSLTDTIKPVLKQLEIPLLKVFIKDDSFFEDANHPARLVLNNLAKLGSKGSLLNKAHTDQIEKVMQRITKEFEQDTQVFDEVAEALDQLIIKQEAIVQRNTERLVKSCDGLQTIENGKQTINCFIKNLLGGKQVPKVLMELIKAGWQELLVFTLLRDGQKSAIWTSYANVVKALAQFSPKADNSAILKQGAGLLKIINIGINEAPGGQQQLKKLIPDLKVLLTPDADSPAAEYVEADTQLGSDETTFNYIDETAIHTQALSRWIKRSKNLQIGSWIEYCQGEQTIQMRLAWVDQDHQKFVFVNHQGMKVVEHNLKEMAEQLQSGRAQLIADPEQPFVDQNLDEMVQQMYNQMNYQATHDELTGLINRKELERQLGHVLAEAKHHQSRHIACHLDLDQFKVVNNSCGHEAGDLLLKQISQLIKNSTPSPNIIARMSGDEFMIVLKDCSMQNAKNIINEQKDLIQQHRFNWDNKTYTVGASVGLVLIDEACENISTIIDAADSALLSAKEAGRNKIHIYQPNDKDEAVRNEVMHNMARLNKALDEDRLRLRCQKIAPNHPQSTEKPHYEILLSVEDELGIHLAPGEFIQAAERYNRMHAIDRWVIHTVFQWTIKNRDKLDQIDCCTVNLSGHSLNDETLMDYILDELLKTEIPRNKICFEVTETAAVKNLTDATEMITSLKKLGFKFALDDFGTGLSSYKYLKKMPVDYLKIDGTFVKEIINSPEDLAMVQSINEMAHLMGKLTVAEYVENQEIQDKLIEIGVDYVQGYHIGKPIPLDNLLENSHALTEQSYQDA